MAETRALYQMLMLALIFNTIMYGVFDWVSTSGIDTIECQIEGTFHTNSSDIQNQDVPQTIQHCEPTGLPYWFYGIWLIINGVIAYAFIPFVK